MVEKGLLHYDLYLEEDKKTKIAFDSTVILPKDNSGAYIPANAIEGDSTLTLDDVSSGYVLNLFVFDKDGNEIKDEESEQAAEEPISITGEEFGKFDTSTKEGKAQLRAVVREHLYQIIGKDEKGQAAKGRIVHNIALDRDVLLSTRGVNEMLNWSGDPRKLKAMHAIEDIIRTAKPENGVIPRQANSKKETKPFALAYYHLIAKVNLAGEALPPIRVIFEEDDQGLLHYDFIIPKGKATLDTVGTSPRDTKPRNEPAGNVAYGENNTLILDSTSSGYVLNLAFLDENGNEIKDDEEPEQAVEEPISITGKEFGEFDLGSKAGKAQLRKAVREHLENNLKGKWIKNKALNREIEIRQRGIDEMIYWSANPQKLQIAAVIEQVIATAKPKDNIEPWEDNVKKDKKRNVEGYYRFTNSVSIAGEKISFDVLIEQDEKGLLHYDFILPKRAKAIMDNVGVAPDTYSGKDQQTITAFATSDNNAVLDNASSGYVLNLFIFDEHGNLIPDEGEEMSEIVQQSPMKAGFNQE